MQIQIGTLLKYWQVTFSGKFGTQAEQNNV